MINILTKYKKCQKNGDWHYSDKHRIRQYNREWYSNNRDSVTRRTRAYYHAHKEQKQKYYRDYYKRNSTTIKPTRQIYYNRYKDIDRDNRALLRLTWKEYHTHAKHYRLLADDIRKNKPISVKRSGVVDRITITFD